MSKRQFKLPGTVGPWFTYWIEYVSEEKLGLERKRWIRSTVQKIMLGNPFGRRELIGIAPSDLSAFFAGYVNSHFSKDDAKILRAYFHSAMRVAHRLGGAPEYRAKKFFSNGQLVVRKVGFSTLAVVVLFGVFVSSMTLDRVIRKQEDLLTASATVLRESGFGVAVAVAENVYYTYLKPPKVGGTPASGPNFDDSNETAKLNDLLAARVANNPAWGVAELPSKVPDRVISPVAPMSGEGEWKPTKILVNGTTAIWIARIRPDKVHTSYWATVTWFDPSLVAFAQVPGTKVPEVTGLNQRTGLVPSRLRQYYVAGLNGGFLMQDSQGGYAFGGTVYSKLLKGKASLVTYKDGSFDVVEWGRDPIRSNVQAIRQNMELIVDGGVSQVKSEDQSKWGYVWKGTGSGKNLVWRSGIGIRADGTMVYVIGEAMSAKSLGDVLVRAGAERAILMDMNAAYANGFLYGPYKNGKKLDSASERSPERFWFSSERDFIAVYTKSPASRPD